MKPGLIIILQLFIKLHLHAAVIPGHLKMHADTAPFEIRKKHLKLSSYLASAAEDDNEKVLIFAYWIAKNIKYDHKQIRKIGRNKIPREVLQDRKAVCGGFSALFQQFCENEGVRSYLVTGYSWGLFWKRWFFKKLCYHAWNVVYVDNQWKLLDVTWCSNELKSEEFRKHGELKWIYMEPAEFAKKHLPLDPRWQLLDDPNYAKEFWKQKDLYERNYDIEDSLSVILEADAVNVKLITIKGQFAEDGNKEFYFRNLARLGWDLTGGSFDSTKVMRGMDVFNFAKQEYAIYAPFKKHKKYLGVINKGLDISQKRLEQAE